MIRTEKFQNTFVSGIDADTVATKYKNTYYLDAENLRIISNDPLSSGSMTSVKGNSLKFTFNTNDSIIGHCKIRNNFNDPSKDSIVFFAYNSVAPTSRIYLFEGDPYTTSGSINMDQEYPVTTGNSKYGYIYRNSSLNFSTSAPIKAEGRYESSDIRKIYWVDGINNIRYMILDRVELTDPVTIFDINPIADMPMPTVALMSGGAYNAGIVQYSYQLYIKNGAATTFAPVSNIVYLTANDGGPDSRYLYGSSLGDNTGKAVKLTMTGLDANYDRIRIVAIHYTEQLINPTINIVAELEYNTTATNVVFIDNGYTVYGTIPIEEFRLFGQTNYIANSLASKFNYLFFADITEDKWNPTWLDPTENTFWDSRAVRYRVANSSAIVGDSVIGEKTITVPTHVAHVADWNTAGWSDYAITHDGTNAYNNIINDSSTTYEYKYQSNLSTLGAEGPNVVVSFTTDDMVINSNSYADNPLIPLGSYNTSPALSPKISSQRTEVYRMYIVFYNTRMQNSNPQWVCDLRMPSNSDTGMQTVDVDIYSRTLARCIFPTVTIRNIPVDSDLYGWRIFRCERNSTDRSVLASGVISSTTSNNMLPTSDVTTFPYSGSSVPYCFIRSQDTSIQQNKGILEIISPEISFNKNLEFTANDYIRVEGRYSELNVDNYVGTTNHSLVTLLLGETLPRHGSDQILYTVTDGKYQSPGITSGTDLIYPDAQTIGNVTYKHLLYYGKSGISYYGNRGSAFIAAISESLVVSSSTAGYIYGSYVRNVYSTQYGGNTYEARTYNSVIPYSGLVKKNTLTTTCYNGDTYITMFAYLRSSFPDVDYSNNGISMQQEMVYIPCESSINCFLRLDPILKYYELNSSTYKIQETVAQGLVLEPYNYPLDLGDLYRYNPVYSKSPNANLIQNTIFDSNTIEHSDVKIIATGKKINNEYFDNWTNLYTNNYIEVDPRYGAIRNIFNFNNKLFVGQDKGISVIAVNDRSLIQDNNKLQLTLGTGGVLERYDYLTVSSGFQNYFDMILSDKSFYYLDRRNKIIYNLSDKGDVPISEIEGYRSFLKSYGTISTVKTGYDPIYKEVFFYISDGTLSKNSILNEFTNSFNGKHTFSPLSSGTSMININEQFYSINGNKLYLHNYGNIGEFYGVISDSTLTALVNPSGVAVNKFDILELRIDIIDTDGITYLPEEQFHTIQFSNSHQTTTKTITFSGDDSLEDTSKSIIKKWRTNILPDDNTSDDFYRFTDTFLKIKMTRENDDNKKIVLHDIITYFRNTKG